MNLNLLGLGGLLDLRGPSHFFIAFQDHRSLQTQQRNHDIDDGADSSPSFSSAKSTYGSRRKQKTEPSSTADQSTAKYRSGKPLRVGGWVT